MPKHIPIINIARTTMRPTAKRLDETHKNLTKYDKPEVTMAEPIAILFMGIQCEKLRFFILDSKYKFRVKFSFGKVSVSKREENQWENSSDFLRPKGTKC